MKRILPLVFCLFLTINLYSQEDDQPSGKMAEATRAMNNRQFKEAEVLYREMLKQNPDDMTLQQLLCHALINQKKYNESDSMLRRMVEKDTNNSGNYWYLGLSNERQGKDSIAADWFKTYIGKTREFTQHNVKAWLHVGSAYRRMMRDTGISATQYADMVYHYEKYLKLNPADPYYGAIRDFLDAVATRKPKGNERLKWDEQN
jgi:tetratricopeptide (TPR) repeat protein